MNIIDELFNMSGYEIVWLFFRFGSYCSLFQWCNNEEDEIKTRFKEYMYISKLRDGDIFSNAELEEISNIDKRYIPADLEVNDLEKRDEVLEKVLKLCEEKKGEWRRNPLSFREVGVLIEKIYMGLASYFLFYFINVNNDMLERFLPDWIFDIVNINNNNLILGMLVSMGLTLIGSIGLYLVEYNLAEECKKIEEFSTSNYVSQAESAYKRYELQKWLIIAVLGGLQFIVLGLTWYLNLD